MVSCSAQQDQTSSFPTLLWNGTSMVNNNTMWYIYQYVFVSFLKSIRSSKANKEVQGQQGGPKPKPSHTSFSHTSFSNMLIFFSKFTCWNHLKNGLCAAIKFSTSWEKHGSEWFIYIFQKQNKTKTCCFSSKNLIYTIPIVVSHPGILQWLRPT